MEVTVVFPAPGASTTPLGLGFAPLDWERGVGAQVWEVDEGSAAAAAGVTPGMVFTSIDGRQTLGGAAQADPRLIPG